MMFKFANSSNYELDIVCVSDPALEKVDQKTKDQYLETTDLTLFAKNKGMTIFRIRALSHSDREQSEIRAGAFHRTELGRILNWQQPSDELEKAKWFDKLPDDEKEAYHLYNQYLQRVCEEMVKQSLVSIDGVEAGLDQINLIRPDSLRSQVFSELILHIRRISLLDLDQKKT